MRQRKRFVPLSGCRLPKAPELAPLLQPGRTFGRPAAVVEDATLSLAEKRAILASWASDACAVESAPTLRQPGIPGGPVPFEEVMEALQALDRAALGQTPQGNTTVPSREIRPS